MSDTVLEEFKYECPSCHEGFDKSGRDEDQKVCCPHCEVLLVYKSAWMGGERKGWYVTREDYFTAAKDRPKPYEQISVPGEIPVIYQRVTEEEKKFYDEPDYVVYFQDLIAETLICPVCGGKTTSNNYVSGSYTLLCENSVYNEKTDKYNRCKTWIEYRFRRNQGIVQV